MLKRIDSLLEVADQLAKDARNMCPDQYLQPKPGTDAMTRLWLSIVRTSATAQLALMELQAELFKKAFGEDKPGALATISELQAKVAALPSPPRTNRDVLAANLDAVWEGLKSQTPDEWADDDDEMEWVLKHLHTDPIDLYGDYCPSSRAVDILRWAQASPDRFMSLYLNKRR